MLDEADAYVDVEGARFELLEEEIGDVLGVFALEGDEPLFEVEDDRVVRVERLRLVAVVARARTVEGYVFRRQEFAYYKREAFFLFITFVNLTNVNFLQVKFIPRIVNSFY